MSLMELKNESFLRLGNGGRPGMEVAIMWRLGQPYTTTQSHQGRGPVWECVDFRVLTAALGGGWGPCQLAERTKYTIMRKNFLYETFHVLKR